jgi:alcohol dehydrogenase
VSASIAVAAVRKIAEHLPRVMAAPDDAMGRFELAQAATLAGIAFSNSMTGLVHALGHAIGAVCHVHHGACMGLLLPYVLEFNAKRDDATADAVGELLLPLEGAEVYATTPRGARAAAAIASIRKLRDALHAACGLPRTLAETGRVGRSQLPTLARMALDEGALAYNPVAVRQEDAVGVLERAYG